MKETTIKIGRGIYNDIVINHAEISSFHAELIIKSDGTLWIRDNNSTNGVFVNGEKIAAQAQLTLSDEVKLATKVFDWKESLLGDEVSEKVPPVDVNHVSSEEKRSENSYRKPLFIALVAMIFAAIILYLTAMNFEEVGQLLSIKYSKWELRNDTIAYEIECLTQNSLNAQIIGGITQIGNEVLESTDQQVNLEEEIEYGDYLKQSIEDDFEYSSETESIRRVNKVLSHLLSKMSASRFDYKCFIVKSDEINAITSGGNVFIFSGMLDFCQSDDELACVIGHEIYHNELGHIADIIQRHKITYGLFGESELSSIISSIGTLSFNQQNELYADLHGLDLAIAAGYDGCSGIYLWERMSQNDSNDNGPFEEYLRSHPFSKDRASCCKEHIESNYLHQCE
mgnify:CR=1 FL=1